jgi:hypothetical protein
MDISIGDNYVDNFESDEEYDHHLWLIKLLLDILGFIEKTKISLFLFFSITIKL